MTLCPPGLHGLSHRREEAAIVRDAQSGDHAARENLARLCQRSAYVFALQLTGNPEDARDIAQDALLRFFAALRRFEAGRPVRPWLLRIVRNLVYDRFRKSRVHKIHSLTRAANTGDTDDMMIAEVRDPAADPEALTARREMQVLLWRGVQQLPHAQREVLVLRDYHDLTYTEIVSILGIPKGTLMSRLHRARLRLREIVLGDSREEVKHG